MAYTAGNLFALVNAPPGRGLYRYDTTDDVDTDVEVAGYFNNLDDNLNLQIGDLIMVLSWDNTPFAAGNVVQAGMQFVVTNVIANDAASSAGNVDIAQVFLATSLLSSLN